MVNEHPRLGTIFLLDAQFECIELTNRLFTIGRSNAHAAVAGLILDLADRLSERGEMQNGSSFVMHLTQEEIGDATGLTSVHVNRTINSLRRNGIFEQSGKVVRLIDRDQLDSVVGRKRPTRSAKMQWLPPSWA
jgi:CRP-like cAMP-binding protein